MRGDNNVVDLQKVKSGVELAKANELAIPLPVQKITGLFRSMAITRFKHMFEEADDILFKRADKAESNAEQVAYFGAMRNLRLKRKSIELAFLKSVAGSIQDIGKSKGASSVAPPVLADDLSLVELDDMESRVAIEAMVTKINERGAASLEHLQIRIQTLFPNTEIAQDALPFGPFRVCNAFSDALCNMDMDIRVRLIVFKLFDRFFSDQLVVFYQKANQLLARLGILPEMVSEKRGGGSRQDGHSEHRVGQESRDTGLPGSESTANSSADSELDKAGVSDSGSAITFSLLQQALRQGALTNGSHSGHQQGSTELVFGGNPVEDGQPGLSVDELVQAVTAVQGEFYQEGDKGVPEVKNSGNVIPQLLNLVRQQAANAGKNGSISQRDADIASLVSLLFSFVLEDENLPERMKQVILTWQIPFLKLALKDASFFDRESHPARHLLNQTSKAVIGWQPKERGRDLLLEKMEKFSRQMVSDSDLNTQVFTDINQEMSSFLDAERRRSRLIAQRLKDAEEGRVKGEMARKKVELTIRQHLADRQLPRVLTEAIEKGWSKKMFVAWLQGGEQGIEWQRLSRFVGDLAWSVDPDETGVEARGRLLQMVPRLRREWREGLSEISYDLTAIDKSLATMDMCHKQSLLKIEQVQQEEPGNDINNINNIKLEKRPNAPVAGDASVSAEETGPARARTELETIWDQRVDQLRIGTWFEFLPKDGKKQRFKLAAAIKLNGRHVFVNRNGVKLAEFEKDELIAELASGRLMPLDESQIFDRALESIISGLRR
ncbi:MAG: hypothetical protein CSB48_12215 [Proteobacteria bacterium]|nr:MAG: hypothetical protein CSB48_12215 [Pseudomonadota bacterium]